MIHCTCDKTYGQSESTYKFKTLFSTRPSDRAQIWHACADRDETGSHPKKNYPTHPKGVIGGYLMMFVGCLMMCVLSVWVSAKPHLLISGTCYVGPRPNLARMCG